jgi:ABC-type uncharacterized transport system involved in gliding motility auxiliary subunit
MMTVLFVGILVVIQAISLRNRLEIDLTRNNRFTLAPQTVNIVGALETDVTIEAFFRHSSPDRSRVQNLLERYARRSERLRYEFIDPDRRPLLARESGVRYETIVVRSGDRRRVLDVVTEEVLTNAILQVTRGRFKAIYFVTGHGESSIDATGRDGYSELRRGLTDQGYQVRNLSLLGVRNVPADCEVLVIAGPTLQYLKDETEKIESYLRGGGSAMFLLNPRVELPGLERVLSGYHVILDPAVILDELVVIDSGERVFDATVTKVRRYEPHTITHGFNVITMYPMARPVRLDEEAMPTGMAGNYLGITDMTAWGEVDMSSFTEGSASRDGDDIAPPLPVSAVVTYKPLPASPGEETPESRIIVIGDSDFIGNSFYGVLGNSDFFLNCISFLAEDEDLISIRPLRGPGDRIFISRSQGRFIFATSIVLLPLSVIVVGTTVMFRRRRK